MHACVFLMCSKFVYICTHTCVCVCVCVHCMCMPLCVGCTFIYIDMGASVHGYDKLNIDATIICPVCTVCQTVVIKFYLIHCSLMYICIDVCILVVCEKCLIFIVLLVMTCVYYIYIYIYIYIYNYNY